jgi:hypothetical protein
MNHGRFAEISEQQEQFETLLFLARTFPHLPPAYVTANAFEGLPTGLRVDTATEAEAWRVALCVPPADVALHRYSDYTTLEFRGVVRGVPVAVYAATPLAPERAELSPQQDADRQAAALLVQRHELEDPAGPPLLVRELPVSDAAVDAAVDFRRSVDAGYMTLPDWGPAPAPAVADVETGGAL